MNTTYEEVFDVFLSKCTDDMYMELTLEDTQKMLSELLKNAMHWFEFPRKVIILNNDDKEFNRELSSEEINIIATYMVCEWLKQQMASVENTRMKYSGSDFKFTSQANHMAKIKDLQTEFERQGFHLQRLYKRRKVNEDGEVVSTFGTIMSASFE